MSSQTFKLIFLDKDNEIIEKHSYGNVLENEVDIFIHPRLRFLCMFNYFNLKRKNIFQLRKQKIHRNFEFYSNLSSIGYSLNKSNILYLRKITNLLSTL